MQIGIAVGVGAGAGAAGSPVVVDTFTRADNASSLGSAETGQAWTVHSGTGGVLSGEAYFPAVISSVGFATVGTGIVHGVFALDVKHPNWQNASMNLTFRGIDASNYLRVRADVNGIALTKLDGGSSTALGAYSFSPVNGTAYRVRVDARDPAALFVYLDDVLRISYTLAGADLTKYTGTTATRVGINSASAAPTDGRFDNLRVTR